MCAVAEPGGVAQKRCSTSGGISIRGIEYKRSSANTGVQFAGSDKRKPTNCCVGCAASEARTSVEIKTERQLQLGGENQLSPPWFTRAIESAAI